MESLIYTLKLVGKDKIESPKLKNKFTNLEENFRNLVFCNFIQIGVKEPTISSQP